MSNVINHCYNAYKKAEKTFTERYGYFKGDYIGRMHDGHEEVFENEGAYNDAWFEEEAEIRASEEETKGE